MADKLYTIGHSNHPLEKVIGLLRQHGVSAVADVRSRPYSRMNPQFNREFFSAQLKETGISYVFLGRELGARSEDPTCYEHGKVRYDLLGETALFQAGIERVMQGMTKLVVALMCAEKDPLRCHRAILVSRHIAARGAQVDHILEDGRIESHDDALSRLLLELGMSELDMFRTRDQAIGKAYEQRGQEIAYEASEPPEQGQ